MKQNDSRYHKLYLALQEANDYLPAEDKKELLDMIKVLYQDYLDLDEYRDDAGRYGIRYKTIHDDSKYADRHVIFFSSKSKRDKVFEDWKNGFYWDKIFNQQLQYAPPSPNLHDIEKVFKEGGKIYNE